MPRVTDGLSIRDGSRRGAQRGNAIVVGCGLRVRARRGTRGVGADRGAFRADDASVERLIREAAGRGYRAFSLLEHDVAKRVATVRLRSENGILDLLFASSGIEFEIVRDAEDMEVLPGVRVKVSRVPHLMALKLLARDDRTRPQDLADLVRLKAVATVADCERLRELVVLIEQRGYHRNRPLRELVEELLRPAT